MAFARGRQSATSSCADAPSRVKSDASRIHASSCSSCAQDLPLRPTRGCEQRHIDVFAAGWIHVSTGSRALLRKPATMAMCASDARATVASSAGYVGEKAYSRFASDTRYSGSPVPGCTMLCTPMRPNSRDGE